MKMTTLCKKYGYSFAAGAFAAGGSFFGKLPSFLTAFLTLKQNNTYFWNTIIINVIPLILMIICNVMNWRYFLKALQKSDQTLTVTTLTAATNYILSFVLGIAIYQETFTLTSTCGAFLIMAGLWFLCSAQSEDKKEKLH